VVEARPDGQSYYVVDGKMKRRYLRNCHHLRRTIPTDLADEEQNPPSQDEETEGDTDEDPVDTGTLASSLRRSPRLAEKKRVHYKE